MLTRVDDEWQVGWDPALIEPSLSEAVTLDLTPVAAERGEILGAGGTKLVTERAVVRFGIDRSQVPAKRAGQAARRLAALVDIDAAAYAKRVVAAAASRPSSRRSSTAGARSPTRWRRTTPSRAHSRWPTRCRSPPPGSSRPRSSAPSAR